MPLSKQLLDVIACPACLGELIRTNETSFACPKCHRSYPIVGDIPLLFDRDRLSEYVGPETSMYYDMIKSELADNTPSQSQWRLSKTRFLQILLSQTGCLNGKRVLNVGCGRDTYFPSMKKAGAIYYQTDIVQPMLHELRTRGSENVVAGSIDALPFRPETFDVVFCIDVVHHFTDRGLEAPLDEMVRVLKPNGRLLIEEPNKYGLLRLWYCFFPRGLLVRLRALKHKRTGQGPAEYEAPLAYSKVKRYLERSGIMNTSRFSSRAYPGKSKHLLHMVDFLWKVSWGIERYLSYHWIICGTKGARESAGLSTRS